MGWEIQSINQASIIAALTVPEQTEDKHPIESLNYLRTGIGQHNEVSEMTFSLLLHFFHFSPPLNSCPNNAQNAVPDLVLE